MTNIRDSAGEALRKAADAVQTAQPTLTRPQAIEKALRTDASLYDAWCTGHAAGPAFDRGDDHKAHSTIATAALTNAANAIWRADPTLTRAQAIEKALMDDPKLYSRWITELAGEATSDRGDIHAALDAIADAADEVDPALSGPAAIERALKARPDMYDRYERARAAAARAP